MPPLSSAATLSRRLGFLSTRPIASIHPHHHLSSLARPSAGSETSSPKSSSLILSANHSRRKPFRANRTPIDRAAEDPEHQLRVQQQLADRLKQSFRPPSILFQNEKVVVIDKPAGCALQAEEGSEGALRWKLISDYCERKYGSLHPVHRLDKSVSGPLILARSPTAARTLSTQFKNGTIQKTYLALVQFSPEKTGPIQDARSNGRIECRMRNRNDRMVIAEATRDGTDCKHSATDWELITATATHAIVALRPETGRKHQLRLHCARFLAAPIVGDFKYAFQYLNDKSKKAIESFLKRESESRVMLHSASIEFKLFRKEEPKEYSVKLKSQLPEDFRILCDQLDLCTDRIR